jgi:hypothetical protein
MVAGILCIIAGALLLVPGIALSMITWFGGDLFMIGGMILGIMPIVAIIGGIYALRRRRWGLALAGSICAFVFEILALLVAAALFLSPPSLPDTPHITLPGLQLGVPLVLAVFAILGILPLALLVMGKREFDQARESDKAIEVNRDNADAYRKRGDA